MLKPSIHNFQRRIFVNMPLNQPYTTNILKPIFFQSYKLLKAKFTKYFQHFQRIMLSTNKDAVQKLK